MSIGRRGMLAGLLGTVLAPLLKLTTAQKPITSARAILRRRMVKTAFASGSTLVRITGPLEGAGKYTGVLWTPDDDDEQASSQTASPPQPTPSPLAVRIINTREMGKQSHDLSLDAFPLIFPAVLLKVSEDGVPVVAIDGLQSGDCA